MKVFVIGGSAKEHAIVWKLSQSKYVDKIYCCPGNAGIAEIAECVDFSPRNFDALTDFIKYEWIDLTIIGDEEQSANGIADILEREGCKVFGANKISAQLRTRRSAAKNFLKVHGILTPEYKVFNSYSLAEDYIRLKGTPIVIKTDNCLDKNIVYTAFSVDEAMSILRTIMNYRNHDDTSKKIILEEYIKGKHATFTFLTDGNIALPFISLYKYFYFNATDANQMSDGIGSYCPFHLEPNNLLRIHKIIDLFSRALKTEGFRYKGLCSLELIITDRPYVVEVNTCMGELDVQTILPRLKTDFIDIALSVINDKIDELNIEWHKKISAGVVLYSENIDINFQKGFIIKGLEQVKKITDTHLFHNNTKFQNGNITTCGGRVMSVIAIGDRFEDAKERIYKAIKNIGFEKMHYIKDIGLVHK